MQPDYQSKITLNLQILNLYMAKYKEFWFILFLNFNIFKIKNQKSSAFIIKQIKNQIIYIVKYNLIVKYNF